jgi:hypothetical protein
VGAGGDNTTPRHHCPGILIPPKISSRRPLLALVSLATMQSPAARAFSILASKIHPQLPLTPRESQQLLSLLTSSFRRHLDREHPRFAAGDHYALPIRRARSSKQRAVADASCHSTSSHTPTNRLLESILGNPLLAHKPSRQEKGGSVLGIQGIASNPSQWFKDRVADGSSTLHTAYLYAETMRKMPTSDASGSQKPGTEIIRWLWASGIEKTPSFLGHYRIHASLAALLIRERNERPLWRWLEPSFLQALKDADVSAQDAFRFQVRLSKAIVLHKLNGHGGLQDAMVAHLHACSFSHPRQDMSAPVRHQTYFSAGVSILNHIAADSNISNVSPPLYSEFLERITEWCHKPECFRAMLHLHHPLEPSLDPALQYIRLLAADFESPSNPHKRSFLVQLSLTLARGLLTEERFPEALWVLEFVKDNFAKEVGWTPPASIAEEEREQSISRDELENLQLLETLNI